MVNGFISCLNEDEIKLISCLINSTNAETIEEYWFDDNQVQSILSINKIQPTIINELKFKNIFEEDVLKKCELCGESIEFCECNEKHYISLIFYKIDISKLIEYFINTFSQYYGVILDKMGSETSNNKIEYNIKDMDIKLQLNFRKLQQEYIYDINSRDRIIISIMPLVECFASNIYEWHEVLDNNNISSLKITLEDLNNTFKSKDFYYLDLGDDLDVNDIENIRSVLNKYFVLKGYSNYTENKKFKPEYINYCIPVEKIKECYIKDNNKILIIKPTEKEINIAYFNNGIIGEDDKLHDLIVKFDKFIKKKVKFYRRIKFLECKSDKTQKLIQLFGPAINIIVLIFSLCSKDDLFKNIIDIFNQNQKWLLALYIAINVLSLIFIVINSILPYIFRILFHWEKGIKKASKN